MSLNWWYGRGLPNGSKASTGISICIPYEGRDDRAAAGAHFDFDRYGLTTPLPAPLRLVFDGKLMLPLADPDGIESELTWGEHWTLCAAGAGVTDAEFEESYEQVKTRFVPCCSPGAFAPVVPDGFTLDLYRYGDGRLVRACLMALDDLVEFHPSTDPDIIVRGTLFACHIRAMDMNMADLLGFRPAAEFVAAAIEAWTVCDSCDPILLMDAWGAQDELAVVLGYKPKQRPGLSQACF